MIVLIYDNILLILNHLHLQIFTTIPYETAMLIKRSNFNIMSFDRLLFHIITIHYTIQWLVVGVLLALLRTVLVVARL